MAMASSSSPGAFAALLASRLCCPSRRPSALCFARLQRPSVPFPCPARLGRRVVMARSFTSWETLGLTEPAIVELPQITFFVKEIDVTEWKGDILAVAITEKDLSKDSDSKFENSILRRLDEQFGGLLAEASAEEDFTGKAGQSTVLRLPVFGFKRLGLVGLGPSKASSATTAYRGIGEAVAPAAKAAQASNAALVLASEISEECKLHAASAIASGALLWVFEDNRFKSE